MTAHPVAQWGCAHGVHTGGYHHWPIEDYSGGIEPGAWAGGPEIEQLLHSSVGPQHKTFRARYNAHANPCATGAHYARARSDAHAIL